MLNWIRILWLGLSEIFVVVVVVVVAGDPDLTVLTAQTGSKVASSIKKPKIFKKPSTFLHSKASHSSE